MENDSKKVNSTVDVVTLALTVGSIVLSQVIYYSGKKELGIFIGLWAPTFVGLGTLVKQTFGKPGETPEIAGK